MHIGITCPELMGHLNPMISLGSELTRRGHRVSVLASGHCTELLRQGGLEHIVLPTTDEEGWDARPDWQLVGEKAGIRAFLHTSKIFRRLARNFRLQAPDALRAAGVDALIVDQFSPGGALVADSQHLPFVVVCNALASQRDDDCPPPPLPWKYRATWLGRLRNRVGYELGRLISEGPWLRRKPRVISPLMLVIDPEPWGLALISQQPAFFDFPRKWHPNHFHYTGPWHDLSRDANVEFPWSWLDGRPLVYASLGTLQNKLRHVYEAITRVAEGLNAQVVLALGSREARLNMPPVDNVLVVPFAPQLKLLERASAAITHAGLNTALECLSLGVPMVCVPVTNDQPGVARRVEWLGAGLYVPLRKATSDRLRESLQTVLSQASFRNAARQAQAKIGQTNGLRRAADIIEEAFTTRQRVRRR